MEKHIPWRLMGLCLIFSIAFGLFNECQAQTTTITTDANGRKIAIQPDGTWSYVEYSPAQSIDSLKRRILSMETTQKSIQLNLTKAHNQFATGVLITFVGTVVTFLGINIDQGRMTDGDESNNSRSGLVTLGGIMSVVGTAVMIDSHKFIGRAGKRRK